LHFKTTKKEYIYIIFIIYYLFLKPSLIVQTKDKKCPWFFLSIPTIFFIVKELCFLPFSTRLNFLNNFLNTSHIEILKIRKCNKYVNLLLYKILVYQILKFVPPYWEFAIENLKKRHCVFLVLERLRNALWDSRCAVEFKAWINTHQCPHEANSILTKFSNT